MAGLLDGVTTEDAKDRAEWSRLSIKSDPAMGRNNANLKKIYFKLSNLLFFYNNSIILVVLIVLVIVVLFKTHSLKTHI